MSSGRHGACGIGAGLGKQGHEQARLNKRETVAWNVGASIDVSGDREIAIFRVMPSSGFASPPVG
jgi:hypothetical protein